MLFTTCTSDGEHLRRRTTGPVRAVEPPEFVPHLERSVPHYGERLLVRPGISGLAQVWLPPDTDLASVRRKLAYDLYYVRHLGPWLDLRLALCTGLSLAGIPFPVSAR